METVGQLEAGKPPFEVPECQGVLLGRKGNFETDPYISDDLKYGGLDFIVIKPRAQTAHRDPVA
jgi:hypothetical protein